jgi:hypothetical protein
MMLSTPCWAITPLDEVFVAGVADEQRHAFGQEGGKSGGQVVDHDDAFAGFHQRMNHMASDIAGATGDEHGHEFTLPFLEAMLAGRGEQWVSARVNWPLCLMLRIGRSETEPGVPIENNSSRDLQLIVPNLHRRYSGVTRPIGWCAETCPNVSRRHGSGRMRPTASREWGLRIC